MIFDHDHIFLENQKTIYSPRFLYLNNSFYSGTMVSKGAIAISLKNSLLKGSSYNFYGVMENYQNLRLFSLVLKMASIKNVLT